MNVWQAVLTKTEEMLAAAQSGAFAQVGEIEQERKALLSSAPAPDATARELLGRIVERDTVLLGLVRDARQNAADMVRQLRQARAGAGAYLGVAVSR